MNTNGDFYSNNAVFMNHSLLYCLPLLLFTNHSLANQNDDSLFELSLDELMNVQVTAASLFAESELSSSSSVSIIKPQDWISRGDRTSSEALSHTTNAMALSSAFGYIFQVRGYTNSPSSRGSATLIDNVPVNSLQFGTSAYSLNNIQLGVLDRIEVVRGSGSALYGTDAFHSAVSYHTFISNLSLADISTEIGEEGFYQNSARFSQPLNEHLTLNIALANSGQDDQGLRQTELGFVPGDETPYELDDSTALIKLHNQNSGSPWQFIITALQNKEEHPAIPGTPQHSIGPEFAAINLSGQTSDSTLLTTEVSRPINKNLKLGLELYHRSLDSQFYINSTTSGRVVSNIFDLEEQKSGVHINVEIAIADWNSLVAISAGRSEHKINRYDAHSEDALTGTVTPTVDARKRDFSEQNINDLALEIKNQLLDDQLVLTYGARIDDYPDFGSQISPRFSAIYLLDAQSSIKLIYGNAFRAPIVGEKAGFGRVGGNINLAPEEIDSYELVYMIRRKNWKAEFVYYESELTKGISIVPDATQLFPRTHRYENSSRQAASGVEARLNLLTNSWSLSLNAAIVDSKNLTEDERHTAYPRWLINSGVGYHINNTTELFLSTQLYDGHDLGDQISTNGTNQQVEKGPFYIRHDLRLSKQVTSNITTWFNIKNLLDKENVIPSVMNNDGGIDDIHRTFSAGIKYQF